MKKSWDKSRICSIPTGCNFLEVLVDSLLDGQLIDGFEPRQDRLLLSKATIFVPTRRTARALSLAFLSRSGSHAQILPKIDTLGDIDDEPFGLAADAGDIGSDLKEVDQLERKLELSTLVQHWIGALSQETRRLYGDEDIFIPSSQADAIRLADDLSRLLDQLTQEEIEWSRINDIIPEEHAAWWGITSTFLNIILQNWPNLLSTQGMIDPAMKARQRIERRIRHYQTAETGGPVIVAGSTGSVPATRRLLKVISQLPEGAIVLPGLDMHMEEYQWQALLDDPQSSEDTLESHPQYGLAKLLADVGIGREGVAELGRPTEPIQERSRIVSTALSLPRFADTWIQTSNSSEEYTKNSAFGDVALVEAANERQEALAIAIALRETLETPNKTAALVTPDRNLAQRVAVELQRYGISVDDSAGRPLSGSAAARFARLIIRYCFETGTKSELVSLLKSPYLCQSLQNSTALQIGETIEQFTLRGETDAPQVGQLADFVETRITEAELLSKQENSGEFIERIIEHAANIDSILQPLVNLSGIATANLTDYIEALSAVLQNLTINEAGVDELEGASGNAELHLFFEDVFNANLEDFNVSPEDFPSVFDALIDPLTVRSRDPAHPRLRIFGTLEIRLLNYDRVILAGLNEGTWPSSTSNDAFLNRTMRQQLGMASPERRTGLAAHDFQRLMGANEIMLTRALRADKAPTIASRWLQRLAAYLGEDCLLNIQERGQVYIEFANAIDASIVKSPRASRPQPTPPVSARPTRLPVTDIETWIRDPYALYAKRILKLRPLDPLERSPDHLLRGTLYHAIFEDYASIENFNLDPDVRLAKLLDIISDKLNAERLDPEFELVWKSQVEEIAKQFIIWEDTYIDANAISSIAKEVEGSLYFANGAFRLHARADRVDIQSDGSVSVLDYKTGMSPSPKQARTLSPQLALEGAIAKSGGFDNVNAAHVSDLAFMRLIKGNSFGLQSIADSKNSLEEIISRAVENLEELVQEFSKRETGYVSRRAPFREGDMSDVYDHLARTKEWSFGEEGDDT